MCLKWQKYIYPFRVSICASSHQVQMHQCSTANTTCWRQPPVPYVAVFLGSVRRTETCHEWQRISLQPATTEYPYFIYIYEFSIAYEFDYFMTEIPDAMQSCCNTCAILARTLGMERKNLFLQKIIVDRIPVDTKHAALNATAYVPLNNARKTFYFFCLDLTFIFFSLVMHAVFVGCNFPCYSGISIAAVDEEFGRDGNGCVNGTLTRLPFCHNKSIDGPTSGTVVMVGDDGSLIISIE